MWDTHPDYLKPCKIPLTIVCGPPCSGKTTYVNSYKKTGDLVIDLDAICMQLKPGYQQWGRREDSRERLIGRAIRLRNHLLARLSVRETGNAWFIVSAPSQEERVWWQGKLGGFVVLLNPGLEECKRRAIARGTPLAVAGVNDWELASEQPWRARVYKHAIGADGYPIEARNAAGT